ncbi:nose resistant to fluoxetine protein 6-like [Amblyomma americanum]
MCSLLSTRRGCCGFASVMRAVFVAVLLTFPVVFAELYAAENATEAAFKGETSAELVRTEMTPASAKHGDSVDYAKAFRDATACVMASIPASIQKKLLGAEISPQCSVALLRTMRAFQNFEPWALRLLDATGKYPTGLLQGSRSDPGAFDECIGTVVRDSYGNDVSRGQYCNLVFYANNGTAIEKLMEPTLDFMHPIMRYYKAHFSYTEVRMMRLGICFLEDCTQEDLQNMVNSVKPSILKIEVTDCVTGKPEPWSTTEKAIVIFLGLLGVVIAAATCMDLFMPMQPKSSREQSALVQFVQAFAATSNTRLLLRVADRSDSERYPLQFLHGFRLFSLSHIVLGHCCLTVSDNVSCYLNFLINSQYWPSMMAVGAFNSVDTFFFLSGFFLCLIITSQKRNGLLVFVIAVFRRLIRTCVPLFFILMCFYIVPLFINGPETKTFFMKFHEEMVEHWWHLLVQTKNLYDMDPRILLAHTWFLSADFQLFIVALPTLLLLKRRKRLALAAFVLLSLVSYCLAAWTLARNPHIQPFLIIPGATPQGTLETVNKYYQLPFFHGMCYFSGCITCLIMDSFRQRKISKSVELAGWCVTGSSMLCCVFMKFAWYTSPNPTSEVGTQLAAFADRFLWSASLAWITLACATGRGGVFGRFLSRDVFVPLSKLSFGVYIIHLPFIELMLFASRERVFWSHFNQISLFFSVTVWSLLLSYISYVACEAPTGALDRLAFRRFRANGSERKNEYTLENGVDVESCKKKEDATLARF